MKHRILFYREMPKIHTSRITASTILLIIVISFSLAEHFRIGIMAERELEDLHQLVKDVSSICAMGVPGPLWALSKTPIPIVAGDEDTTPVPSIVVMASGLGSGRVVAFGHDGFLTNEALGIFDNERFGNNNVIERREPSHSHRLVGGEQSIPKKESEHEA